MVKDSGRLTGVIERMDRSDVNPAELACALADLARINRVFGGTRVVLDHLDPLLPRLPSPTRILDVGTGYADLPRAIARRARRRGLPLEIEALDHHGWILACAARACADYPEIRLREGDALALPYPDRSVDVAIASQLLHHMEGEGPVRLLRELRRVARHAVLVGDLRRGAWPFALTWAALHLLFRNPLIRHDGPLSIRRGFVPAELLDLARAAGWEAPQIFRHSFFRLVLMERMG
jgi:SAM-dependent methyltransferase